MKNRIYGVVGIESKLANWNADFEGMPRRMESTDTIYGTDKALKYSMRNMWNMFGEDLLIFKELKIDKDKMIVKTLEEKYTDKYGKLDKSGKRITKVLENLFNYTDVKQFGVAFATTGNNVSITGAVQIMQGIDVLESETMEVDILSPFASGEGKGQSTLGKQYIQEHSLYLYPFTVNPLAYKKWVDLGVTDGYTEEDYNKFKEGITKGATMLDSCSKVGCSNNFAIFVKVGEKQVMANLNNRIFIEKEDNGSFIIDINIADMLPQDAEVEVYYNNLKDTLNVDVECKKFNIITGEEI